MIPDAYRPIGANTARTPSAFDAKN